MSRSNLFLSAALLFAAAGAANAAPADAPVMINATRTSDAPASASITTITAEDIARRASPFLADVLAAVPGVSIAQNGPFGGIATIRVRGALSEQSLVLIDGVNVNDPSSPGGGYNAGQLDTAQIASVDVLRGPQSTLWGADAIGGVINIVTKKPGAGLGGAIDLEAGSFSTKRAAGAVSGSAGAFDGRVGFSAIETDGISKADEKFGNTEKDPYKSHTLDARVGADIGESARLEGFWRYTSSDTALDGFGLLTGVEDSPDNEDSLSRSYGAVARVDLFGGKLENVLQVSRADISRQTVTPFFSFGAVGVREALRYQATFHAADGLTGVFGAEQERSEADTGAGRADATINGLFALGEWRPLAPLTLTAGIRRDDHDAFGEKTNGAFGAAYAPAEWLTLRANWTQGFKAPTIYQLTSFFAPATAPNVNLTPEEAEGWDAGVELAFVEKRYTLEATYFSIDTDNLIQFVGGRYENIAKAESTGVELIGAAKPTEALTVQASYTYTEAEDATTGAPLRNVPKHLGAAEIDWQATEKIAVTASARYKGSSPDVVRAVVNPQGINPRWTRLDLTGRYALTNEAEVYLRVENVTDKEYEDVFGYGMPGRSAYIGVRVRM
ncbi:MAG: TonB-dependent receptor plug domain-containing protein [Hyphomonadaceae bacterium]